MLIFELMAIFKQATHYSAEEYLAMEEVALEKNEFHNGQILQKPGETIEHSLIIVNTASHLIHALKGTPFRVFESSLKVKIESANSYVYPDTTVICGTPERDEKSEQVIKNPMLIVEVLSDTTGAYDRGTKFHLYQQIPTFREYMMIEQKIPQVDVFYKNEEGQWMLNSYFGLDARVELRSLNVKISMAAIYEWVDFGAA